MSANEEWWQRNKKLKQSMGLPEYTPPCFQDGTYVHKVIDELEERYDCSIQLAAINPQYPDDWDVRVGGTPIFTIGRHRNDNGNTVYELTASEFRDRLEDELA